MQDRRKQVRKSACHTFVVCDADSDQPLGLLVNLTTRGAKIVSREPIEVPRQVHCRMALPYEILGSDQVRFDSETKWCKWSERTGMYETGCEFARVDDEEIKVITALVEDWPISEVRPEEIRQATGEPR